MKPTFKEAKGASEAKEASGANEANFQGSKGSQ
jgi:hypothetical protein